MNEQTLSKDELAHLEKRWPGITAITKEHQAIIEHMAKWTRSHTAEADGMEAFKAELIAHLTLKLASVQRCELEDAVAEVVACQIIRKVLRQE